MKISERVGRVVVLIAALLAAACSGGFEAGESGDGSEAEAVAVVESELVATGSGAAYATQCSTNGVPLPPNFGSATMGTGQGKWVDKGNIPGNGFAGDPGGKVYMSWSSAPNPVGLCVILIRFSSGAPNDNLFSVICQGDNGYACFWEGHGPVEPPAAPASPVVISGSSFPGGTALPGPCTACHAGQNAFITHFGEAGHPLNGTVPNWKPSQWFKPIVPAGFVENPGPSTQGYVSSCITGCHTTGGTAGGFPTLSTFDYGDLGNDFCSILERVVSIPASKGGMPPTSLCDENGANCPINTPEVQAMIDACGAPIATSGSNSPVGLTGFSSTSPYSGRWDHIFTGTQIDSTPKVYLLDNLNLNGNYQGWNQSDFTSSLDTTSRVTMFLKDGNGSKVLTASRDFSGTIRERTSDVGGSRVVNSGFPATGSPYGYVRHDGFNVIVFRGTNGTVYESLWTGVSWSTNALPGFKAVGDPVGYKRGTTSSVVYKCERAAICEVRRINGNWTSRKIDVLSPLRGTTMPMPFKRDFSGDYMIFYAAQDGLHVLYDFSEPSFGTPDDVRINTNKLSSSPIPYNPQDSGIRVAYIVDPGGSSSSNLVEAILPFGSWDWSTVTHITALKTKETLVGDPGAFIGAPWRNTILYRNSVNTLYQLQTVNSSMGNVPYAKTTVLKGFIIDTSGGVTQQQEIQWGKTLPAGKYKFDLAPSSGDPDLYVKIGSAPTTSSYDCRPYFGGTAAETCTSNLNTLGGGTIFFMVRGFASGTSNFTLKGYHIE